MSTTPVPTPLSDAVARGAALSDALAVRGALYIRRDEVLAAMHVLNTLCAAPGPYGCRQTVLVRHTNPCWIALNDEAMWLGDALEMFTADPVAAMAAYPDLTVAAVCP